MNFELMAVLGRLNPQDYGRVETLILELWKGSAGRALCECCGEVREDVTPKTQCTGLVPWNGEFIPCANKGDHWQFLEVE